MSKVEVRNALHTILIENFKVDVRSLETNRPLDKLDENFKILGYLIFLEQLINKEFSIAIPLLESISASIHTPEDLVELIVNVLKSDKSGEVHRNDLR